MHSCVRVYVSFLIKKLNYISTDISTNKFSQLLIIARATNFMIAVMKVTRNFLIKTNNLFGRKYLTIIYILQARDRKLNFNCVFLSDRTEKYVLISH